MAFVSESIRSQEFIGKSASGTLGPGEYFNEGLIHKQAMDAIYPKKEVPFNSQSDKKSDYIAKNISPGPGSYHLKSNFDSIKYVKSLDNQGTYLTIDNGHLNQRKQQYSKFDDNYNTRTIDSTTSLPKHELKQQYSQIMTSAATPGPGQYEISNSFISNEQIRKMKIDISNRKARQNSMASLSIMSGQTGSYNQVTSPQPQQNSIAFGSSSGKGNEPGFAVAQQKKQRLANLSIPSIPSRFLTPVLQFDLHEKDEQFEQNQRQQQITESVLVAKVARLTNDGSNVGPGQYNVDEAYKANQPSPRGNNNWAVNKTKRQEHFVKKTTQKSVGPGAYSLDAQIDRSIKNPTIPRADKSRHFSDRFGPRKRKRNNGSIRANWEEGDSSDDEITPGPGAHLQHHHTSTFGMIPIVHDHPQNFGSVEKRFINPQDKMRTIPGPGQYLSQNVLPKFQVKMGSQNTQNFKTPARTDLSINPMQLDMPGPQQYAADQSKSSINVKNQSGSNRPFGTNIQRFTKDDNGVPGAGTYKLPDSVQVKNAKQPLASFKSNVEKSWDIVIGRENPGIGEYDTQHLKTIASKEFQGGAANNFVLFTRKNYQDRNQPIKVQPRIPDPLETTPADVGPGSYISRSPNPRDILKQPSPDVNRKNLQFGTDIRFKQDFQTAMQPGPGQYNDQNKWNKRTYNLKFLNFQTSAFKQSNKPDQYSSLQMGGQNLISSNPYVNQDQL